MIEVEIRLWLSKSSFDITVFFKNSKDYIQIYRVENKDCIISQKKSKDHCHTDTFGG
jgi:hypothetical protein